MGSQFWPCAVVLTPVPLKVCAVWFGVSLRVIGSGLRRRGLHRTARWFVSPTPATIQTLPLEYSLINSNSSNMLLLPALARFPPASLPQACQLCLHRQRSLVLSSASVYLPAHAGPAQPGS